MKKGIVTIKDKETPDLKIRCCAQCPFKGTDGGGPGEIMICYHPAFKWHEKVYKGYGGRVCDTCHTQIRDLGTNAYDGAILHNREMDIGFPDLCPFFILGYYSVRALGEE